MVVGIIHRPYCDQSALDLLSTKEIVLVLTLISGHYPEQLGHSFYKHTLLLSFTCNFFFFL